MPHIIDGHNLIGKIPEISLQDLDDEIYLINLLEDYFRITRKKALVFFDNAAISNKKLKHKTAFLEVSFIRKPRTADQAIIAKLKMLKGNARNYTVVSSDRWIVDRATRSGAKVMLSENFWKLIQKQRLQSENTPDFLENEVDFWLKKFNPDS